MKARVFIAALLLSWPVFASSQHVSTMVASDDHLWLTVDCAASEAAKFNGCVYQIPPPKVIFYEYPVESDVCTAETPSDMGIRCVPFGVFKAWLANIDRSRRRSEGDVEP